MRIAIVNWSRRKAGGAETYLSAVIPELSRIGHEIAFLHEVEGPVERDQINLTKDGLVLSVADGGAAHSIAALKEWDPDLIYMHTISSTALEAEILNVAPAVFFAHAYYGTCISGTKTFKAPVPTPCGRRFGWQCLLHYYPHRCGGLSPVTMLKRYSHQSERLRLLFEYEAIVTNSKHMREEYVNHGLAPDRVYNIPIYTYSVSNDHARIKQHSADMAETYLNSGPEEPRPWRLIFVGRMDLLKGGEIFLDALARVCALLDNKLHVVFAGDGPERTVWERKAKALQAGIDGLQIDFVGWFNDSELDHRLAESDLLVVPSLWPEPFGLVGPEAGFRGVPAAAFAVGGIPDWLTDGVNGHLAPGDPPTSEGLAQAIVKCLKDPEHRARLRTGALELAGRFSLNNHFNVLLPILERVASRSDSPC